MRISYDIHMGEWKVVKQSKGTVHKCTWYHDTINTCNNKGNFVSFNRITTVSYLKDGPFGILKELQARRKRVPTPICHTYIYMYFKRRFIHFILDNRSTYVWNIKDRINQRKWRLFPIPLVLFADVILEGIPNSISFAWKKVNSFSSISTNFITSAEFTFGSGKRPPVELGCSHKVDQCPGLLGLHRVAI